MTSSSRILIIDFGSQYTQLIARRVREMGVYCEVYPCFCDENAIQQFAPRGIILSGGPESVTLAESPRAPDIVFRYGCPVLGICYGLHTMALQLGGKVQSVSHREFGFAELVCETASRLFPNNQKGDSLPVWMSHGDSVTRVPAGFITISSTANTPIAAIADETRHFYGLQFHPEVTHTPSGKVLLRTFVQDICGCTPDWTPEHILSQTLKAVKTTIGNDNVILALSGGVDSAVVAALLHGAVGPQLTCIFIDTGLLRRDEQQDVVKMMQEKVGVHVVCVDAADYFLNALKGVADPEQKRKIIGKCFIDMFEEQAHRLPDVKWLAQGTIYSDVIESAASAFGTSHVIKSHHNVGGLPENMLLKLVEPLRELFKDEVRLLGTALGLPHEVLYRHPFPGPGLAVRILGEVKPEYIAILQQADAIFIEELHKHQLYHQVSQAFAVFLPVKSVAVMGDARQYAYVIALRAVVTTDFMTAEWAPLPHAFLSLVSHRILNEVPHVSRVVYDISGKPPSTIEWE